MTKKKHIIPERVIKRKKIVVQPEPMHDEDDCKGYPCPFHNPSNHHMKYWQMQVRYDKFGLTERICEHNVGHPDPDSLAWMERRGAKGMGIHGCDGCCVKPKRRNI